MRLSIGKRETENEREIEKKWGKKKQRPNFIHSLIEEKNQDAQEERKNLSIFLRDF